MITYTYVGPILDISFPLTKPQSVDSERDLLKPSHFNLFHKLPHYIIVLVNLLNTMFHIMDRLRTRNN
jgi:hypothetical protein